MSTKEDRSHVGDDSAESREEKIGAGNQGGSEATEKAFSWNIENIAAHCKAEDTI